MQIHSNLEAYNVGQNHKIIDELNEMASCPLVEVEIQEPQSYKNGHMYQGFKTDYEYILFQPDASLKIQSQSIKNAPKA